MARVTMADEIAALVALRPSRKELEDIGEALETVLAGIQRGKTGWRVDPALTHLTHGRSPAVVIQTARRGMRVLRSAERMLACGT